jgi:hypothetical protein
LTASSNDAALCTALYTTPNEPSPSFSFNYDITTHRDEASQIQSNMSEMSEDNLTRPVHSFIQSFEYTRSLHSPQRSFPSLLLPTANWRRRAHRVPR